MMTVGSLLLVVILVFVYLDGTFLTQKYASVWSDQYIDQLENEQSKMIAYGIRAASSHNTQPWLVKSTSWDTIELYANMDKALDVVDGDYKQLMMSQGTFIKSYKRGALQYGYGVEITYHSPDFSKVRPLIATIKMGKEPVSTFDVKTSSTYDSARFDEKIDLKKALDECMAAYPGFSYTIVESSAEVEKLENLLLEGTIIESQDEAATKELLEVFRFTEWEKNKYRYGLSLNTVPGILKPFIQPIVKSSSKDWQGFGESSIKQFKDRLDTQNQYVLIKCNSSSNLKYIYSGEIYQNLIFEVSNFDLRPSMQVLESFDAMKSLNQQFQQAYGSGGEVVLIIGLQEKPNKSKPRNPRHLVEDIIIN